MSKNSKFILWSAFVAITSFWMWASAETWLSGGIFDSKNLPNFGIFAALLVATLSLMSMGFIVFRGKKEGIILSSIVGLTYFLLFGITNFNLVGVSILILIFIFTDDIVSGEMDERIKMNSRILIRKSMMGLMLGVFILVSFAAYESPAIKSFKNIEKLPSSSEIFIKTIVDTSITPRLEGAGQVEKDAALDKIFSETMGELNVFLEPYFEYIPPALAFGLFLILWSLGWVFLWLAVLFGVLVFHVLKWSKFFRIEEKDVKAETIVI